MLPSLLLGVKPAGRTLSSSMRKASSTGLVSMVPRPRAQAMVWWRSTRCNVVYTYQSITSVQSTSELDHSEIFLEKPDLCYPHHGVVRVVHSQQVVGFGRVLDHVLNHTVWVTVINIHFIRKSECGKTFRKTKVYLARSRMWIMGTTLFPSPNTVRSWVFPSQDV